MKTSPEDVLKSIPDFDELIKLTQEISQLMYEKLTLDNEIKEWEAHTFKTATTDEQYFQGGKPPAVNYIDNTYKFRGLNGEIMPLRIKLAEVIAKLEGKKSLMDVYKTMIEVWRTLCSNQRTAGL